MSNVIELPRKEPFENGISSEELMRRIRAAGGKATDGVLDLATFERGWGKACFTGDKVHHWRKVGKPHDMVSNGERLRFYSIVSLCGLQTVVDTKRPIFGGGNFPYCKRCEAKLRRRR